MWRLCKALEIICAWLLITNEYNSCSYRQTMEKETLMATYSAS